jgi:glycosyltransferase involved in cell wall biosynthesis
MMRGAASRIAFLASSDPRDQAAQSGSLYYMVRALRPHLEEIQICDPITSLEKRSGRLLDALSRRLFRRTIAYDHLAIVAKKHGRIAATRVGGRALDAVLAVMNPVDIACLRATLPITLILDATFARQRDYYPQFTRLWEWSASEANSVERAAYQNASQLVYASSWASQSAIRDYDVDAQKVHVASYGANLESIPSREEVLQREPSSSCRLLFVGVGWEEKGGGIALDALVKLDALGIEAQLTICGATPPRGVSHERMTVIPFLDKRDRSQRAHLERLFATSDFLLLPTRREAFGHVFCEASAFGVPSITTATGAVPEVVRDGENGYALPYDATGIDYAQVIAAVWRDRQRYVRLVASSRAAYEERMNWDRWARTVKDVLDSSLPALPAPA